MQYTQNYNLSLAEGTDQVNLLTQCYPNFTAIDTVMKQNADNGVTLATEVKTGTNHALTRQNKGASVIRFVATSNYSAGDTFTVDAEVVSAVLPSGEALPAGAFVINASVIAVLVGTQLTVFASKSGSTDAETLEGHPAEYFATAEALQAAASDATDALEMSGEAIAGVADLKNFTAEEKAIGTFNGKTVYRRIYTGTGSWSSNFDIDANFKASNVDMLFTLTANIGFTTSQGFSWNATTLAQLNPGSLRMIISSSITIQKYVVVVEYTKP